jgi:hypothetical protein
MLGWDSMPEREKRLGGFLADREWVAGVALASLSLSGLGQQPPAPS